MFLDIALYTLSAVTFAVAVVCIVLRFLRNKRNDIIYSTQYFWVLSVAAAITSVILAVLTYYREDVNTESMLILTGIVLLSLMWCVSWCNETVVFGDDGFTVGNFFGIKRFYKYKEVTAFKTKIDKDKYTSDVVARFYVGKKSFSVLASSGNYSRFFSKLNGEYKKYNNGQNLPKKRK